MAELDQRGQAGGRVASGISGPQSAADLSDETGGREKCLRNRLEKRHFWGVAWPRDAKPTHPGAAGGTVDQNWAKTLPREAGWSKCGVEIREAKRKFRFICCET